MNDIASLQMMRRTPAYTLEWATEDFDGRCRLVLEGVPVADGSAAHCIGALGRLIDPYDEPFGLKVGNRASVVVLRTGSQRAEGVSSVLGRKPH